MNSVAMDNNTVQRIKDIIAKGENLSIAVGKNPSLDEMAGALSLFLAFREANKRVSIACPTDPLVEISSLVGIDKVQNKLSGDGGDLTVSFPYQEGEIEKVSYTVENGYLNIIVKAGEHGLSFDERDIKYIRGGGLIDLLFIVGTPSLSDLEGLYDEEKFRDTTVINIDNKQNNQGFGDVVLVSPKFSSVSEQITDFILSLGLRIDKDTAQNLLSGIIQATDNFQSPNTSMVAFEMSAFLMRKGAQRPGAREHLEQREQRQRPQLSQRQNQQRRFDDTRQQHQSQPQQQAQSNRPAPEEPEENQQDEENPPSDWLTPKVFKGSSNV